MIEVEDGRPFKVCNNEELGRYLVSTRSIEAGEVIVKEAPLVSGPLHHSREVCLGCLNVLDIRRRHVCRDCGWLLCSKDCERNRNHYPECFYTSRIGGKNSIKDYTFSGQVHTPILALRCLFQKQNGPEIWRKLNTLESHFEKNRSNELYETIWRNTVNDIHKVFKLQREFTEAEIRKVCNIINVNHVHVSLTKPPYLAIYETASLFEHNCKANCYKVYNSKGILRIIAAVPIKEGEHLSVCYTVPLWSTIDRQQHLQNTYLFTCRCERCLDETKSGLNYNALKCLNKNCQGILLPESFLTTESEWNCNKCTSKMAADSVNKLLEHLEMRLQNDEHSSVYKTFLQTQKKMLPEDHNFMIRAKLQLIQAMHKNGVKTMSDGDVELTVRFCREMDKYLNDVVPAEKGIRGEVLYTLQALLTDIHRRKMEAGTYTLEDVNGMKEQKLILNEVIRCFKHDYSKYYKYKTSKSNLKMVEDLLVRLAHFNAE